MDTLAEIQAEIQRLKQEKVNESIWEDERKILLDNYKTIPMLERYRKNRKYEEIDYLRRYALVKIYDNKYYQLKEILDDYFPYDISDYIADMIEEYEDDEKRNIIRQCAELNKKYGISERRLPYYICDPNDVDDDI